MRAAGQRWLWIAYPEDDLRTAPMLDAFRERFRPHHRLVYLHFSELDWVGHAEGPHAPALRARLREIDAALREVVDHLEAAGKAWNAMIFGDHGMVPVGRTVDARAALEDTGLRAPEDYVYFLDSTQARCWFRTENARTRVEQALSHLSGGRILTDEDLARLRFRFADHRFGELIWMADEGVVLSPNFFQGYDPVLGMHGYLPEAEANWGKLIAVGSDRAGAATAPVDMVELFPLLRQLLNLESERI
jgi:predicted AlkP superfamily pyrophosphatase or phosphodiesterase